MLVADNGIMNVPNANLSKLFYVKPLSKDGALNEKFMRTLIGLYPSSPGAQS